MIFQYENFKKIYYKIKNTVFSTPIGNINNAFANTQKKHSIFNTCSVFLLFKILVTIANLATIDISKFESCFKFFAYLRPFLLYYSFKNHLTLILFLILSNLASPIPLTFFNSSILLNNPFLFLNSIILAAKDGPIPDNVSSSV